jgi:hypothetical protein
LGTERSGQRSQGQQGHPLLKSPSGGISSMLPARPHARFSSLSLPFLQPHSSRVRAAVTPVWHILQRNWGTEILRGLFGVSADECLSQRLSSEVCSLAAEGLSCVVLRDYPQTQSEPDRINQLGVQVWKGPLWNLLTQRQKNFLF